TSRIGMLLKTAGEEKERDASWLDWSVIAGLSPDGKSLLFFESGEGGGPGYSVYLRKTDEATAVRLGEGSPGTLSPGGERGASGLTSGSAQQQIALSPAGAGEARKLTQENLSYDRPDWLPDGRHIIFTANEPGRGARVYTQDVAGGRPRAITPEGYRFFRWTVSPDGRAFAARGPDHRLYLYPVEGGEPTPVAGISTTEMPVRWSADGRSLSVYAGGALLVGVVRAEAATAGRKLWRELMPADAAGVVDIVAVCPTPDGASYAYSYARVLSNLYLVDGLR